MIFYQLTEKKGIFLCAILLFSFLSCETANKNSIELHSPNGNFNFVLRTDSALEYAVKYLDSTIIDFSHLGFNIRGDSLAYQNLSIEKTVFHFVDTSWSSIYGERNEIQDRYNEALIVLTHENQDRKRKLLRVRAYDEGIAFRYEFPENTSPMVIEGEQTEFNMPSTSKAWVSQRAQSEIYDLQLSDLEVEAERPVLAQLPNQVFLAIGEAALIDFARMKFYLNNKSTLESKLSSAVEFQVPFASPWRYVMAAKKPDEILNNNYLILNLNEPCKIDDTSWIKPGKVIREVTLTTQGGLACVDFASRRNLQFVEFDAGWYGNEYDTLSDATTITVDPKRSKGPLDLHLVIDYAKTRNIGVILYVNRRALERQLDEILPLYKKWGVAGVKYGFVQVGSQQWTSWLHEAVRKAAKYQLMVDIHDEYRPTGYSRTYPNLMTQEGIRGDEESPDNAMVLNTLFTRMIAGAGDHTNCFMAERVTEKMGSHGSQMAKSICLYSPWQFLYWYDRPLGSPAKKGGAGGADGYIPELAELKFFDELPTVWDDSKVLDGYPGEFAIIARRNGDDWFVGALNGPLKRTINVLLDFLDKDKKYTATIFSDDKSSGTHTNINMKTIGVHSKTTFDHQLLEMNGMAMIIKPDSSSEK